MDTNESSVTVDTETTEQEAPEQEVESTDWKAEANKWKGMYRREQTRNIKLTTQKAEEPIKQESKPDDSGLLKKIENLSFRQAGITHEEDKDLARSYAKKWNMDMDELLVDEDFLLKLHRQQTSRANADATSNIRGGKGTADAKKTAEFYLSRGTPPSADEVPDRKLRAQIMRGFMAKATSNGKTFYNE